MILNDRVLIIIVIKIIFKTVSYINFLQYQTFLMLSMRQHRQKYLHLSLQSQLIFHQYCMILFHTGHFSGHQK